MTEELVLKNIDILERLKQTTKINGAYPRDIADAIKEIELLRNFKNDLEFHLNQDKDGSYFLTQESYYDIFGELMCS